jgi:hypothetical protein
MLLNAALGNMQMDCGLTSDLTEPLFITSAAQKMTTAKQFYACLGGIHF